MKRLKYAHPFCGKVFPFYIMLFAFIGGMLTSISFDAENPMIWGILLALAAGALSAFILHIPDDHDRAAIANADYPLWETPSEELLHSLRLAARSYQLSVPIMLVIAAVAGGVALLVLISRGKHGREPLMTPTQAFPIALVVGSVTFVVVLVYQLRTRIWEQIDETAVCATIPIDHFFDLTRHGRYGKTWTDSYLVFYLPDGKYIIKAKEGSGLADNVTVIKYRGMLRCMTLVETKTWRG